MRFNASSLTSYAFALSLAVLTGCGPMITQSPGAGLTPVNAVAQGEAKHLMLFGHDVVSYFTKSTHEMGSAQNKSVHEDVTFWFASSEHKALFDAAPQKFLPQYGGYCTNGIAYGIPWGGDADLWKIVDGKLYIFGGQQSFDAFFLEPEKNMALAEMYWNKEVRGRNALLQRLKRMTFRVPHYKSGSELAAQIAKAKN